jgi:hypothetical protein
VTEKTGGVGGIGIGITAAGMGRAETRTWTEIADGVGAEIGTTGVGGTAAIVGIGIDGITGIVIVIVIVTVTVAVTTVIVTAGISVRRHTHSLSLSPRTRGH